MTQTPPGWYPDGQDQTRYWDGQQWTGHTMAPRAPAPVQIAQGYPVATQPRYPVQQTQSLSGTESNGLAVAGFVIGIVSLVMPLILGVVLALTGLGLSIPGAIKAGRTGTGKTLAIWGIVLSSLGLILIL